MSDNQAERAIQQLYEDTSARDELSDDEANVLLQWGETQIRDLGARDMDDTAFDEAFAHLRGVMKNINRYTGQRAYKTPEELTALLNELATEAQAMGVEVQAAQLTVPEAQGVGSGDNIAVIQALTALVTPAKAADASAQTPPPPASPEANAASDDESLLDKFKKLF
ncbi:MAG: hypothetical protein K8I30_21830 [Anaerolineae bacterium]|nr:hypothetical protein [Anaerolineae bacterium]